MINGHPDTDLTSKLRFNRSGSRFTIFALVHGRTARINRRLVAILAADARLAIRALSESRDYKINWSRLATIGDPSDEHRHTTRARSRRPDYPSAESTPSSSVPVAVLRSTARRCPPPSRGRPTLHVGIIRHRADDLDDCFQYQLLRYVAGDTSRRSRFFVLCHRYRLIGVGSRHRRSPHVVLKTQNGG
jgi:hypothetical protein